MARSFAGTNSNYLSMAGTSPLQIHLGDFSIGGWVYPTGDGSIITKHNLGAGSSFVIDRVSQKLRFLIRRTLADEFSFSSTGNLTANQWNHFICTYNSSDTWMRGYINGAADGSFQLNVAPADSTMNIVIGNRVSNDSPFNGRIGELFWYNTLLNADERAALAAKASPRRIRPSALVGYWPLWGASSPEPDLAGTRAPTVTGTVAQGDHAPVGPPIWTPGGVS
jgi:hypothetical protein